MPFRGLRSHRGQTTKITHEGIDFPDAAYMAPDRPKGEGSRCAVRSVVVGSCPLRSTNWKTPVPKAVHPAAMMYAVLHEPHPSMGVAPLEMPGDLTSLIEPDCLRKDPVQAFLLVNKGRGRRAGRRSVIC